MQRKPGFPVANCSIKMPECPVLGVAEPTASDDDPEQQQKRLQLINFGHTQWGFNNWSWAVTKQEVDFVDFTNGKYCAGVVAFVNITVKSFDIHRENIGYATSVATSKGFAVYKSRKCAVTNALRETLLSFGGSVATELTELLESTRSEISPANLPPEPPAIENNQNVANRPAAEPKNSPHNRPVRKDSVDVPPPNALRSPLVPPQPPQPPQQPQPPPAVKNAPTSKPLPLGPLPPGPPANRAALAGTGRPAPAPAPGAARPNSNVSFVLQPVVGSMVPPLYGAPPRLTTPQLPHVFPPGAYYEYPAGPWHFAYESYDRPPGNVNLNFNLPPKNLVVNGRGGMECRNACRPPDELPPPTQPCWIKPTIFYDGFWTEQKVKKWVAEQVEKQFPEDSSQPSSSPAAVPADSKA
ncbi:uncharacterized protein LOC142980022 isoform X3 [Anticarsia gemmatalis]|uniref:uncharacterized protein LOC142980022 isoform X3 n=1 Tax=Anticarsia gemmatalis TaxID=129554 RepID=UPI003F75AF47